MSPDHVPSPYLTDEANTARMTKLIARIAKEGLRPGESVPARIMAEVRAAEPINQTQRRAA